jgi:hypothetical protein
MRSRFAFKPGGRPLVLPSNHPAVAQGRPIFPTRVFSARNLNRILIPAESNPKIGGRWEKGWPGTRIFTLSLPERTTCPRSCLQWQSCYGNHQRWTVRVRADEHLMPRLEAELAMLSGRFEKFSVRLHNLGDFYSTRYARFWIEQTRVIDGLHLFGFTARPRDSKIGKVIEDASREWDRVRIRFSGSPGERSATVAENAARGRHGDGITCPAQTGDSPKCESCGLCLTTRDPIVFRLH